MAERGLPEAPPELQPLDSQTLLGTVGEIGMDLAKTSALPVAGGLLGAGLGALTGPLAPIGVPALSAAGSGLGEVGNQMLGITEPSWAAIGISMIPGGVVGPAGRQALLKMRAVAPALMDELVKRIGPRAEMQLVEALSPKIASKTLFQRIYSNPAAQTIHVGTVDTRAALRDFQAQAAKIKDPELRAPLESVIRKAESLVGPDGQYVPFEQFDSTRRAFGGHLRRLMAEKNEAAGAANRFYDAMWKDIDRAVGRQSGPMRDLLHDAVAARKREEAQDVLQRILGGGKKGQGGKFGTNELGQETFDVPGAIEALKRNRETLRRGLPDGDIDGVVDSLMPWVGLAKSPTQGTAQLARQLSGRAAGAGMGAAAGGALFGPPGAIAGANVGVVGVEVLSRMLMTSGGRSIVRRMAVQGGGLGFNQFVNVLGQGGISLALREHIPAELQALPSGPVDVGPPPTDLR